MVRLILSLSILLFTGCGVKESKNTKFENSDLVNNEFITVE